MKRIISTLIVGAFTASAFAATPAATTAASTDTKPAVAEAKAPVHAKKDKAAHAAKKHKEAAPAAASTAPAVK